MVSQPPKSGTIKGMDPIQEVAEAAAKRKEQIRKWQQAQVDADKAVTFLDNPLPKDPSPEEVQKVNMQGADETLGGPANEEASEGEAPTYEDAGDVAAKAEEAYPADEEQAAQADEQKAYAVDAPNVEAEQEEAREEAEDDAPAQSDKKDEWVAYRVKTHGLTEEEAKAKTKDELIALD